MLVSKVRWTECSLNTLASTRKMPCKVCLHGNVVYHPCCLSQKKCLQDLSTPVHGVGKVDGRVSSDVLDQLHTPIKVGVNAQDQGSVGYGLNQLSQGDFVSWQEDNGGNASGRTVC